MNILADLKYHDFPSICRICLKKDDLRNIFETVIEGVKIVDIFKNVLNEQIVKDEKPQNICQSCIDLLAELNKFCNLYHSSKKALESVLDLTKCTVNKLKLQKNSTSIVESVFVDNKANIFIANDSQKLICNFCNFNLSTDPYFIKNIINIDTRAALAEHIFTEHLITVSESRFKCLKCKIDFPTTTEIEKHFYTDQHQIKTCLKCNLTFNTIKQYFVHTQACMRVRKTENEVYNCVHCHKTIDIFENVLKHYREKHNLENTCIICNKVCKSQMRRHLYKHRPDRMKFLCLRCYKCFETETELSNHKRMDDHVLKECEICHETFTGRKQVHAMKHKKESFVCELCGKSFKGNANLFRHKKTFHFGRRFYCDQCPMSHTTAFALNNHIEKQHPESIDNINRKFPKAAAKIYNCPICSKMIPLKCKNRIKMHKIFHERGDKLKCQVSSCELTFPNNGSRLEHMSLHHEKFICDQCKRQFFNFEKFQTHCLVHTWQLAASLHSLSNIILCYICQGTFENEKSLSEHTWKQHKIHLCPVKDCGAVFFTYDLFNRHKSSEAHGNNQLQFACNICNDKFRTETQLSAHQKRHDEQNRKFKCSVCNLSFVTMGQLKRHSLKHTGEKPYACRFCSKSFAYGYGRTVHERIHTGEKPLTCPYCEKRFSDGGHRSKHVLQHKKLQNETSFVSNI